MTFNFENFILSRILHGHARLAILICIGTLLHSNLCEGAKTQPVPELSEVDEVQEIPTDAELQRAKSVHITPVKKSAALQSESLEYFYSSRSAISFRAGAESSLNDIGNPGPLFGLLYTFPALELRSFEVGADLGRDGSGTLHAAQRWMIGNEKFRWFYKLGGGVRIVASDQLVTFLRLRNWQARLSGGFEYTIVGQTSFRLDTDAIAAIDGFKFLATVGIAIGW